MNEKFETVISGISGRFPDCESVPEFRAKLYSGKSFMSLVPDRWPINFRYQYSNIKLPSATGKFKFIKEFDPIVFQINSAVAACSDAINRKILEPAFECVMDSGINPYDLGGKNISVYMAYDHSDSDANSLTCVGEGRLWVLGSCRAMMSNRVSFALNLTGPSFTFTNDMFGNLAALNEAYKDVSEGRVEAAIVGIGAAIQHPMLAVNMINMNLLSPDSATRVFDKNANGYGRSDAVVCLFIQRAEDAKRVYASIDFTGYTYFGSNSNSYYNFDEDLLKKSFEDLHQQDKHESIDDISFVEMSACGIQKFDKVESNFIADTFCKNKKSPLFVGSVKSNVGVADSAGPYVSIIKALFALESGVIAPNIDLSELNNRIRAFAEKKLQVVIQPTLLTSDKILVNSVGMTGSLSQVVLRRNTRRQKKRDTSSDNLLRLILVCSRTADGIEDALKQLEQINYDEEFISLANDVFGKDMPFHIHRGYSILSADPAYEKKSSKAVKGNKHRPVWFLFSGMGSQWNNMGEGLLRIPIIAETVKKCNDVLKNVGVDIYDVLTNHDPRIFDNVMHSFVGIITIQVALVEVLKALGIKPDGIIGHSVGENGCAYADGCLTLEQAVLSSYARGMASIETKTIKGMMAAVGKGYNEIKDVLPETIEVACHNSSTSCTLSGPTEDVEKYVQELEDQKIFAKAVNVANIAYHSKHIAPAAPNLLARLKEVIPNPVKRSSMWVSTSVAEADWDKPLAQYCSAEYLTNNLLNCVMFEEGCKHIPSDALVIEIAPHGLLQAIVKRSLPETCANVALTRRNNEGKNLENLLTAIGQLYFSGLEVNVNALYPPIEYPVSRETSSVSQLARWHHVAPDARVYEFDLIGSHSGDPITIHITDDSPYHYLRDHQINNQIVVPTSFFLYITWYVFSIIRNKDLNSHAIVFEDVLLHKNITMSLTKCRTFNIFIQKGSGKFEILKFSKSNSKKKPKKIMTGILSLYEETMNHVVNDNNFQNVGYSITSEQFYQLFKNVGYQLNNTFQSLEELSYNESDCYAKLKWKNNWVTFLDSILKFAMFSEIKKETDLFYTQRIRRLEIAADQFSSLQNDATLVCRKQIYSSVVTCNGLKMYTIKNKRFPLNNQNTNVKFEGLRFVSFENPRCQDLTEFCKLCLLISVDNVGIMLKKNHSKLNVAAEHDFRCFDLLKNLVKHYDSLKFKVHFHEPKRVFNKFITSDECYLIVVDNFYDIEKYVVDSLFFLVAVPADEPVPNKIVDNFVLITNQQFADEKFYLLKKKIIFDKKNMKIETENWSTGFSSKTEESEAAFVVKQNINSKDVSLMCADSRKPSDSRYLFVMDNEIPSQATLERQQILDLPVSVLQNGEWGSYQNISEPTSGVEQNTDSTVDLPGDVQLESIHLRYLSCDKEVELHNQICHYGIEYSGVEDGGERVMGLSLIDSNDPISKPDPTLKWKVPEEWTLEEAATVPFVYAQAYRILDVPVIRGEMHIDSILVNIGEEGAFCEACIAILLNRNYTVYISVANDEEALLIKNKFPQLDDDQIFNLQKQSYQTEILKMTKGSGVNLVINCFQQIESVDECMNCLRDLGFFIQIGKPSEWENYELSLYSFLKALSFAMIPNKISNLLTVMSVDEKEKLKIVVENGIRTGVVVPFDRNIQIQGMPVNAKNNKIGKKTHLKNIFTWFPNNDMCHFANQRIRYDSNRSFIIVGGEKKNSAWFDLVEWLISKGARKFIAIVDNFFLGPSVSHRINRLLNQKKATIILSSSQKMETLQDAESLVHEANRIAPLEAVFFMSVGSTRKNMYNMDLATRLLDPSIHLVSIFSGGLKECESRRFAGSPAVVIHCNKPSPKISTILSHVDKILSQFDNSNSPTLYRIINTENKTVDFPLKNYLPHDISNLEKIADDLTDDLKFVEVTTRSPRYSYIKDCAPVFVISALGPKPLQCLLSNLMSPAFCASIGTSNHSVEESALKLYESLTGIQSKGNTSLISETWATPIAFELIKLLERDNRKYKLFTLDGNPFIWKDRVRNLGPIDSTQFENNLIAQLFNVDSEIRLETLFDVNKPLPEKLSDYLCGCHKYYQSVNVSNIIKVLCSIRLGFEMVSKYENKNQLLKNVVSIVRNSNGNELLNFSMTSESYVRNEDDYFKFLSSSQVYDIINNNVLYTLWYD